MKQSFLLLIFSLLLSCSVIKAQSGWDVTTVDINQFTVVKGSGSMEIEVSYGPEIKVTIHTLPDLKGRLNYFQSGEMFEISYSSTTRRSKNPDIKVFIEMPELLGVNLYSGAKVKVKGTKLFHEVFNANMQSASALMVDSCVCSYVFMELSSASSVEGVFQCNMFSISASSASTLNGTITASSFIADISGASTLNLAGNCENVIIKGNSASTIKAEEMKIQDLTINLNSASSMRCLSVETIKGSISGASKFYYGGTPSIGEIEVTGASSLKRI